MRDLKHNLTVTPSLLPAARTTTATGSIIDTALHALSPMVEITAGAWTDGTHTFTLEEGDDSGLSDAATVAAAQLQGTMPVVSSAPTASQTYTVGYTGWKRYLRVKVTVAGATTGAVYGANIVQDASGHRGGPAV